MNSIQMSCGCYNRHIKFFSKGDKNERYKYNIQLPDKISGHVRGDAWEIVNTIDAAIEDSDDEEIV
ncbi:MAG: hypothetical protein K2N89_14655 [Lachnospiraceae bacterium]|nr:hypothetical protein [Lachnospiraceae bacterium]